MVVPAPTPTTTLCGFGVPEPEQRFVLDGISWEQYEAIGAALEDHPNLRLTFDDGRLEFMSKSPQHNRLSRLIVILVAVLCEECDLEAGSYGDTTLKQKLAEKGLEPDECFYHANCVAVRNKDRFDMAVDPPPDMAVEVDVTSSSIPRMNLYASLKVPEIWRWVGGEFRVFHLNDEGGYDEAELSQSLVPNFPVNELLQFLEIGRTKSDTAMMKAFRKWLQSWLTEKDEMQ